MKRLDSEVKTTYPSDMYSLVIVKGDRTYLDAKLTLSLYRQATVYMERLVVYRLQGMLLRIVCIHSREIEGELK